MYGMLNQYVLTAVNTVPMVDCIPERGKSSVRESEKSRGFKTRFVGVSQDVDPSKQARAESVELLEKLVHLNRVNAMGEFAASLAHEIRQPLMIIQTQTAVARTAIAEAGNARENVGEALSEILAQSTRANDIIREMQAFLKSEHNPETEIIDIVSIANNVLTLLSHEVRAHGIRFELDTDHPLCHCAVKRIQMEQVLFNLISNAIDSLRESEGEKRLRLSCERHESESQCVITVQDNGKGIPEEHMARLWDPFFTTKAHGMGQGLAICRSILRYHGGDLSVENAVKGGAVFRCRLPLAPEGP